ncbi:histidine-type phosphatase [Trinickia sp. NRRL B-1857]|uniref:histidine-type phosphatase n=1 Tax=Trinickia sp. NRRL B-1857 TaxID=3162879 RepID=UPI003D2D236B
MTTQPPGPRLGSIRLLGFLALVAGASCAPHSTWAETAPATAHEVASRPDWQLESVVIVSRHGVRSPTKTKPPLAMLTHKDWPTWPVQPGELTARGASLIGQMGGYYGAWLRQEQVLPAGACPAPNQVAAWADVDQRTRLTGDALLEGIAPGCTLRASHQQALDQDDPVFHATESGQCKLDPATARAAIDARLDGEGLDTVTDRYRASLEQMEKVLDFSRSPYCEHDKPGAECRFSTLANRVQIDATGRHLRLDGPLGIASTVSEVFLLEYAQGMAPENVAWGAIHDRDDWARLLAAHNAQFDLMAKTPYLATRKGTPLMADILGALTQSATGTPAFATHAPASSRVYVLAAHDTNLANLAGMLGLDWTLPDQPDDTPPGGALVFSLWRDKLAHADFVTVELVYQSLSQLREMKPLTLADPPSRHALAIPECADSAHGNACRLDRFMSIARRSLAPDCLVGHE